MEKINEFLEKHYKEEKYIVSLEELYLLFEQESISIKDRKDILKKVYEYNKLLQKKEQNKKTTLSKIKIKEEEDEKVLDVPKIENKRIEPLSLDVSNYVAEIRKCYTYEELKNVVLPNRDDPQFENILSKIIINLYKEKVEIINAMRFQEESEEEIIELFEEELDNIDSRIEYLLDYKNYEDDEATVEEDNQIIFLKNSSLEPFIFQNLKGHEEYYDSFLELISRIKKGNFKHMRNFTNTNNKIVNVIEVKAFKTRVLFTRIKDNTYVVLAAFIKKCDTDLRHRHFVEHVSKKYQVQKNQLLSNLENPKFIVEEENWLQSLNDMLSEKKKVKVREIN